MEKQKKFMIGSVFLIISIALLISINSANTETSIDCEGADINQDGNVGVADLSLLTDGWGSTGCNESNDWCNGADINQDGRVENEGDLGILTANYGANNCSNTSLGVLGLYAWCDRADINQDGNVSISDLSLLGDSFGRDDCNESN
ncbi:MAG: hypothetical protein ACP5D2_04245, partial [Candidatus Nanoarchaeia archaeon]